VADSTLVIDQVIGNFRVLSLLGSGGMGDVYLAEHTGIQTRVAIKMLHAAISRDADHVQRFFNEARIVGRIKHAGIAKIFDVGFHLDRAYLVMELLEGESLAGRVQRGRLAMTEAVDIAYQIASILAATHQAGFVHRDLKPDNIFLVPDAELARPRVKILDFGIAKLGGTLSGGPRTIGTMGTPAYMAPEQWGDAGSVDWRADIYSLGCVAFEMVAGRPPFPATTIVEAFKNHTHTPPPSVRTIVDVPEAWDALVTRLLAKQPAERADSITGVAQAFDQLRVSIDPDAQWTTATNPSTARAATTLGSTASQVVATTVPPAAPKRKLMFAGVFAALIVAIAATTIVVKGSGGDASTAASQPAPPPAAAPQPVTAPPAPPPKVEPAVEAKVVPATVESKPAPKPTVKPAGRPVAKPAEPRPVIKPAEPKPAPAKPAPTNELEDRT